MLPKKNKTYIIPNYVIPRLPWLKSPFVHVQDVINLVLVCVLLADSWDIAVGLVKWKIGPKKRHKETDCQGHIRKIGMSHLQKARGFDRIRNWMQTLRYSELALVKLKQLNDRPIEALDDALTFKFNSLNFLGRHREALECAKERYCMYLTSHTHPPAIEASFALIQSCIHNKEYEGAALYARTTWETITLSRDSHIPDDEREWFTAQGAHHLALAMLNLAQHGDIPPEENQSVGQEAIGLARRELEIRTQLHGLEHQDVANTMRLVADALDYFNNVGDVEVLRLHEQSIAITARVEGGSSMNVAVSEQNVSNVYLQRAKRARAANDLDREMANLEQALTHYRAAARISRVNNFVDKADAADQCVAEVEEEIRQCAIERTGATAATTRG